MARVVFELPSVLDPVTGGERELAVEAATIDGALQALFRARPALRAHLFDESGDFRQHVLCLWNGRSTRWLESRDVAVADGDRLRILQAVSGG